MTDPDEKPSYRDIARWSSSIASYWKFLAAELELPEEKIHNISKSLAHYPTLEDQALQMLQEWREAGNATYRKMAEALRTMDKGDLADKICPPQRDLLRKPQHKRKHSPPATLATNLGEGSKRTKTSEPMSPPQNVRADSNGLTSILVKWDEVPQDEQNGVIQKYEVIFKDEKTGKEKTKSVNAPTRRLELTELESFRKYDISVVAYADGSAGPASHVVTVMTGEQEFGQIRQQLAEFYVKNMGRVQVAPWDPDDTVPIDNVYTRLSWSREARDQRGTEKSKLKDYTDIFVGLDRKADLSRIVVFGQGGIGKSTFTQKLSVDWARGEKESLKRFDLVLIIKLRDLRGDESEFKDIIVRSKLLPSDDNAHGEHLHMYIKENQARVLILFDGFDEYDQAKDPESVVNRIVRSEILRDCHVVVTTRPERLDEVRKFMQAQCKINGFTQEDMEQFATKYVGEDQCGNFMYYLWRKRLWDMALIPLMLLFLCLLWKERAEQPLPSSKTDLYQQIVHCVVDHCESKRSPGVQTDLDKYHETLCKIGKVAFEALLRNSLVFHTKNLPEDVLREDVVRLGFLSMSKVQHQRFKSIASFFHKSIQEFLAAWYISKQAIPPDTSWTSHLQDFDTIKKLWGFLGFALDLGFTTHQADAVLLQLRKIREKESNLVPEADKMLSEGDFSDDQTLFQNLSYRLLLVSGCKETSVEAYVDAVGGVVLLVQSYHNRISDIVSESVDRALPILFQHSKVVRLVFTIPEDDQNKRKLMRVLDEANVKTITWACGQSYKYVKGSVLLEHTELIHMPFSALHMLVVREGTACYLCYACTTKVRFTPEFLHLFQPPASHESHSEGQSVPDNGQERTPSKHQSASENNLRLHALSFVHVLSFESACTVHGEYLAWILRNTPHLIEFYLSDNPLGPGVSIVAAQLGHLPNLQDLTLSNTQMTEKEAADLSTVLDRVPGLGKLDLSNNSLGPGVSAVAAQLQHLPNLENLDLSNTEVTEKETADLFVALVHVPGLSELHLSGNTLGPGVSAVAAQLQHLPELRHLNLSNTEMTEKEAADLSTALVHVPCLEHLDLSFNPLGPRVSVPTSDQQHLPNLDESELPNAQMTETEATDLSTALATDLDLSDGPRVQHGAISLAEQIATHVPKLISLDLRHTGIDDECRAALEKANQERKAAGRTDFTLYLD